MTALATQRGSTPSATNAQQYQQQQHQQRKSRSIFPRIISGSIGSIVTALVVTPLEVVKVRQQTAPAPTPTRAPQIHRPCPSCGTIVFNNGLMECIVSRKSVPYMDQPKVKLSAATVKASGTGISQLLRQIYVKEGFAGIYAGLAPTLVMSVPNTVLYFTAYDELVGWLRRQHNHNHHHNHHHHNHHHNHHTPSEPIHQAWMPLVAGSAARLIASLATAPLELIRTRQAISGAVGTTTGVWGDLTRLVRTEGLAALFQGLAPTLCRDVPFSAIYWFSLEQFKLIWQERYPNHGAAAYSPLQQAGQAFINGAAAGTIAAACTTPFDVVKTRHQALVRQPPGATLTVTVASMASATSAVGAVAQQQQPTTPTTATAAATTAEAVSVCHHNGATAVVQTPVSNQTTILGTLRQVVAEEGVAGLWRGNATRIYKVAPACAIMISCYELGKLLLE